MEFFDFSEALRRIKEGKAVARHGWSGKGMFLFLVPGSTIVVTEGRPLAKFLKPGTQIQYQPHIDLKTSHGTVEPWVPTQEDLLQLDWFEIEVAL